MKGIFKFLLYSLIFLGSMSAVNALTVTLNVPATGENITTSPYVLNATASAVASEFAVYNCTFYYETSGVYTKIADVSNTSAGQTEFTNSWTWTSVADGAYDINATCREYNETDGTGENIASDENTNVGLDDTGPTITMTTLTDATKGTASTVSVTCLDSDFSNEGCSACSYYQVADSRNLGDCLTGCALTISGTSGTYSYTPDIYGVKNQYVECTDQHSQKTNATQTEIRVHSRGSGVPTQYGPEVTTEGVSAAQKASETRNMNIIILAIMLVAVSALLLAKK
jgi:hypothetical protein